MRKLIRTQIVLAAFTALAVVPATASAVNDPLATWPTGTKLEVSHGAPAKFVGTSVGSFVFTNNSTGTLTSCPTASLEGNLETNTGTGPGTGTVEATVTSVTLTGHEAGGKCTSGLSSVTTNVGNGTPWCLKTDPTMETDAFMIRGGDCTSISRPITLVEHTNVGECRYSRTEAIFGTYKTHPAVAVFTLSHVKFSREGSNVFCPPEQYIDVSFALEIEGEPLYINNQPDSSINDPLVTWPTGTKLEVSHGATAKFVGTNVGSFVLTNSSTGSSTTCPTASLEGNLETNTGIGPGTGTVEATVTSVTLTGHEAGEKCASPLIGPTGVTTNAGNGVPWCLRATTLMATDEFMIRGNGCTSAHRPITLIEHTTEIGECRYSRSEPISGTYKTHPEATVLTLSHVKFSREAGSHFFCSPEKFLDASFALEIEGKPLYIDNQ